MIFRYKIEQDNIILKDFLEQQRIPKNVIKNIRYQNGQLIVNDQSVSSIYRLKKGDLLEIVFPSSSANANIKSVKGDFEIAYEDSYLLLVDKYNNVATIPTREHYNNSLANYIMSYYKRQGIEANIHFISRLDVPTSGLILLAKNSFMHTIMKSIPIVKKYLLVVEGYIEQKSGIIELCICKDQNSLIKRMITKEQPNSKTEYKVIKYLDNKTLVEATLWTGKTHQLRLHFSYYQHPIVGDALYGSGQSSDLLYLHSYYLSFRHPITNEEKIFINYPKWYKSI